MNDRNDLIISLSAKGLATIPADLVKRLLREASTTSHTAQKTVILLQSEVVGLRATKEETR